LQYNLIDKDKFEPDIASFQRKMGHPFLDQHIFPPKTISVSCTVFREIYHVLGLQTAERGGLLGSANGLVCRFYYDSAGISSDRAYYPSIAQMNRVLKEWAREEIVFSGIIHSHPHDAAALSKRDLEFAGAILKTNPELKSVFFPLVLSAADSAAFRILPYVVDRDSVTVARLCITNQLK